MYACVQKKFPFTDMMSNLSYHKNSKYYEEEAKKEFIHNTTYYKAWKKDNYASLSSMSIHTFIEVTDIIRPRHYDHQPKTQTLTLCIKHFFLLS